jgi:hypothetical protein
VIEDIREPQAHPSFDSLPSREGRIIPSPFMGEGQGEGDRQDQRTSSSPSLVFPPVEGGKKTEYQPLPYSKNSLTSAWEGNKFIIAAVEGFDETTAFDYGIETAFPAGRILWAKTQGWNPRSRMQCIKRLRTI